jgi:hypothetical protein
MHHFLFARPTFWRQNIAQNCLENLCGRANSQPYDMDALNRLIHSNPMKSYSSEKRSFMSQTTTFRVIYHQSSFAIPPPVLKSDKPMAVQIASVAGSKENPVKCLFGNHCASVPAHDLCRAMAVIFALLVCPMSLRVVVSYPFSVNLIHFLPTLGLMERKVGHSACQ